LEGLVATAFYQLLVKTRQDKLEANSFQLLHYQAPQSALLVAVCTPFFDKTFGPGGFFHVSGGGGSSSSSRMRRRRRRMRSAGNSC